MSKHGWRDGNEFRRERDRGCETPRESHKTLRWMSMRLRAYLLKFRKHSLDAGVEQFGRRYLLTVIENCIENRHKFFVYRPDEVLREGNRTHGEWALTTEQAVLSAFDSINHETMSDFVDEMAERAVSGIRSLDEWLRADLENSLDHVGFYGGAHKLSFAQRSRLEDQKFERNERRLRACATCGIQYRPGGSCASFAGTHCVKCRRREANRVRTCVKCKGSYRHGQNCSLLAITHCKECDKAERDKRIGVGEGHVT